MTAPARPDAALAYLHSLHTEGGWRSGLEIQNAVADVRVELERLREENARLRRALHMRRTTP